MNETSTRKADLKNSILREQVRLVMKQLPMMQSTSFVAALILCYTARNSVPRTNIYIWLALMLLIIIGRIVMALLFTRVRDRNFNGASWEKAYLIMALVSGSIWGGSAFIIFPSGDTGLISLFVLVMASLSAATTVSHSFLRTGAAAWMLPALLLYALRCAIEWKEPETTIALLIVIYLASLVWYSFNHHDIIMSSISFKFENLQLLQEARYANDNLRRISALDGLTGLANRRNFDDFLEKEWRRAGRNRRPIALILLDIDHFKAYNDNYGHPAGDECLRKVAAVIQASMRRPADFVARYGGEEFVVVLPETDGPGAAQVAERLRSEIEGMGAPHAFSSAAAVVTISAGSSSHIPQGKEASSLLVRLVDDALYAAKMEGRNRVKAV